MYGAIEIDRVHPRRPVDLVVARRIPWGHLILLQDMPQHEHGVLFSLHHAVLRKHRYDQIAAIIPRRQEPRDLLISFAVLAHGALLRTQSPHSYHSD